jgi:S1-C subfamily serine protease
MGVSGVLVLRVQNDSAADRAGLRGTRVMSDGGVIPGDVIMAVEGRPVARVRELVDLLEQFEIGDRVELQIYRDGNSLTVSAVLGPPKSRASSRLDAPSVFPHAWDGFGTRLLAQGMASR